VPILQEPRHLARRYEVVVVGGGPAGLAAALGARERGAERVLLVDREAEPGGILLQCIHAGFGLHAFDEEITGPEYAQRFAEQVLEEQVDVLTDAHVLDVASDGADRRRVRLLSPTVGMSTVETAAVVLAMGARERTRAAIHLPGDRPSGVMTAGLAQRLVNLDGYLPGRRAVILGSGDIGLIMARRLTLEGVEVVGVFELLPYPSGLTRNLVQCLDDLDIPLHLSTTVVGIHGRDRLERVTVAPVDDQRRPVMDRAWEVDCDTLLLSIGLVPDAELARDVGAQLDPLTGGPIVSGSMETTLPGVFAAGNVVHVNDLADWVSREARLAGEGAGALATGARRTAEDIRLLPGDNVRYVVPHTISSDREHTLSFRVQRPIHGPTVLRIGDAHRRKVRAVVPAEMVTVKVAPRLLEGLGGCALRVDAVPADEEERRG
jgi:NADPH-dependent 2,4-dienoyl-CoA reductase/sulfur reductase-like enzyme